MAQKIQIRRDTAANWTTANPLLAQGEPGHEIDTGKVKFGNGIDNWNSLIYQDLTGSSWTQTGSGAVTRTVDEKLKDMVSVKDFGAIGDGVADDTVAIQAAINAASGGTATVLIPDGVYRLTAGLTIPSNGITIEGEGFGRSLSVFSNTGTRLLADFATGWVITCNQACFTLRDIEIYGSDSVRWASSGSVDGTKGAIYLRDGVQSLLERVQIFQEPGIGIYLSHECPSTKLNQVCVEFCKSHAYYIDDGALDSSSGYIPSGIITFDSCRAARVNGCAVFAGDPNDESGTGLSAYRLLLLNCEFFFCGGDTSLSSHANHIIKLYADNCLLNTCAVSPPNGQAGGNSATAGTLNDGVTAASLVRGIFVQGRNNTFTNTRLIRCQAPAIVISATASSTTINGIEARHTGGINYNPAIDITSGTDGFQISGVNDPQVDNPSNISLSKIAASSQPVLYQATDGTYIFCGGDGLFLDPAGGSLSYYSGTTQQHRFGTDGTFRSRGAVRPISNNVASLGVAGVRWTEVFAVNGTINTSDANYKQQIQDIPESVLKAWGKVKFQQYKFNHAVERKGDDARWHHGVIAQEVKEAFESEGLDPFSYGILCYDQWEAEYNDNDELTMPAGSSYGIRYEEAYALECAYLRWRFDATSPPLPPKEQ
jgi:hypothetical protein